VPFTLPQLAGGTATLVDQTTGEVLYEPGGGTTRHRIDTDSAPKKSGKRVESSPVLAPALTVNKPDGTLVYVIPLDTRAEANQRDWRAKNRRAGAAWKAVRSVVRLSELAPYEQRIAAGGSVDIRFVRIGGRFLDPLVNLPSALKGVEDVFAFLLDVDDRSPLWRPSCGQETGSDGMGVRVEIA
jgi:hypothetical protein